MACGLLYESPMESRETAVRSGIIELEPETVLPSQFFSNRDIDASLQPEKRLMLAVLEDAVGTFQKFALSNDRRAQRIFTETEEWFASGDRNWPYSFPNIAEALNLEPEVLRAGLWRWRDRQRALSLTGEASNVVRFPFRRVNGTRHSITGRPVGLRRSA
jgi:hypothetical protein